MHKDYQKNTPEKALQEFLFGWKNRDWNKMLKHSQITWKSTQEDAVEKLKSFFAFRDLEMFEVLESKKVSDMCMDVSAVIKYSFEKAKIKKIRARVIREIEPYRPSESGTWGVNPISVLRECNVD